MERGDSVQGMGDGSEESVQDQVIIAPEHLDLRGLKQVRLVCKSWLREAQLHVEERGIVRLDAGSQSARFQEFIEMRVKKLPALPQPFKYIDVELEDVRLHRLELLHAQLSSLCPPLAITTFSPNRLPFDLALALIIKCSSSLEVLSLDAITCKAGFLPLMEPEQTFPQLQSLDLQISVKQVNRGNHFASIVAWIVKSSPKLERYASKSFMRNRGTLDTVNEMVLKVDIKKVKILKFLHSDLSAAAVELFSSIPFSQLQHLEIEVTEPILPLLVAVVANAATTLRKLRLFEPSDILQTQADFPICLGVHELELDYFEDWDNFVSHRFPSLQVLNVYVLEMPSGKREEWICDTPFSHLKELKVLEPTLLRCKCIDTSPEYEVNFTLLSRQDFGFSHHHTVNFFKTFPALERLHIVDTFLLHCCRLKATGNPKYSNLLEGVKHLGIVKHCHCWDGAAYAGNFSSFAVLKGVESIRLKQNDGITTIPVAEMTGLKVISFPWDDGLKDVDGLLKIAKGVEKVIITNCCSVPRTQGTRSKELLNKFFDSAPNAKCGCKDSDRK